MSIRIHTFGKEVIAENKQKNIKWDTTEDWRNGCLLVTCFVIF